MTDKELHHLKRAELLEILFYMQNEIDRLKEENKTLHERVENLTQSALDNKLSQDTLNQINETIQQTIQKCLGCLEKNPQTENDTSERSSD